MKTRELRENRAKLIADAQAILKSETRSKEDVVKANRMLDDSDVIKSEYEAIERADSLEAETRSVRPVSNPAPGQIDSPEARAKAEEAAFRSYIVGGKVSAEAVKSLRSFDKQTAQIVTGELRDMGIDTDGHGGYLVPKGYNAELERAQKAFGPMLLSIKNWKTDSGNPITQPLSDDTAQYSQEMTDGTDVTESDVPLTGATFTVSTFTTGLIKVSRSLLQDSAFDMASFINESFGVRVARGLNKAATLGSTSGNVAGLVGATTKGADAAAATAVAYGDLINMFTALNAAYRGSASWMFNSTIQKVLIGLVDDNGRPLFIPSLTAGIPDSLFGRPIVLNEDMANVAASSKSVVFGDLSKYVLRTAAGLEVLRLNERYAPANQVGFVGFHRHAGKLLDAGTHPVVHLLQPAS